MEFSNFQILPLMNLAVRGSEAGFGPERADTFRRDLHPDQRADYVLAYGSTASDQSDEDNIRRAFIEVDLVDYLVALPGQLFYSTQIPVCLWFYGKNNMLDSANDAGLLDGETELSLVA